MTTDSEAANSLLPKQARQESLAIARAQRGQSIDTAGRAKGRDAFRRGPSRPGRNRSRLPERSEGRALIRPGVRSAATPSVAAQAGPAGIEPATPGFGDRCSTN